MSDVPGLPPIPDLEAPLVLEPIVLSETDAEAQAHGTAALCVDYTFLRRSWMSSVFTFRTQDNSKPCHTHFSADDRVSRTKKEEFQSHGRPYDVVQLSRGAAA